MPPGFAPLTYQLILFDVDQNDYMPLSVPQMSNIVTFLAPTTSNSSVKFVADVCDHFRHCQLFFSNSIEILPNFNISAENLSAVLSESLANLSAQQAVFGNVQALSSLLVPSVLLQRNRRELSQFYSDVSNETKQLVGDNDLEINNSGEIRVLYYILTTLIKSCKRMNERKDYVDLIKTVTVSAKRQKHVADLQTLNQTYSILPNSFVLQQKQEPEEEQEVEAVRQYYDSVRQTLRLLVEAAAAQVATGQSIELGRLKDSDEPVNAVTAIYHKKYLSTYKFRLETATSDGEPVETVVTFGREFRDEMNQPWPCGDLVGSPDFLCESVVFSITVFSTDKIPFVAPPFSHRLTAVVDLAIHVPRDGLEYPVDYPLVQFPINGTQRTVATIAMTLTGNDSYGGMEYSTRCHYFDEVKNRWRHDKRVVELGIHGVTSACWTSHMATFVVLRIIEGVNPDYIFGVLVAVLMGVLIFGIMVVFFVQKKEDVAARVTPNPVPKHPQMSYRTPKPKK